MTDLEHLDELERHGDSLLDEEQYRRERDEHICGEYVEIQIPDRVGFYLAFDGTVTMSGSLGDLERVANAILSECEIVRRGDSIR